MATFRAAPRLCAPLVNSAVSVEGATALISGLSVGGNRLAKKASPKQSPPFIKPPLKRLKASSTTLQRHVLIADPRSWLYMPVD